MEITSRENPRVKQACALRDSEKQRAAAGLFFAEGPKLVLELAHGCALHTLLPPKRPWPAPRRLPRLPTGRSASVLRWPKNSPEPARPRGPLRCLKPLRLIRPRCWPRHGGS